MIKDAVNTTDNTRVSTRVANQSRLSSTSLFELKTDMSAVSVSGWFASGWHDRFTVYIRNQTPHFCREHHHVCSVGVGMSYVRYDAMIGQRIEVWFGGGGVACG